MVALPDQAKTTTARGGTTDTLSRPKDSSGLRRERQAGSPTVRIPAAADVLLGPVLYLFAGLFHVLSEAVSSLAANAYDGQESGHKERKGEPLQ